MPLSSDALQYVPAGECVFFLFTRGDELVLRSDGSGSTGWWRVRPRAQERIRRIVIYRKLGKERSGEVFTAVHNGLEGPNEDGRHRIHLLNVQRIGVVDQTWPSWMGAREIRRYVRRTS